MTSTPGRRGGRQDTFLADDAPNPSYTIVFGTQPLGATPERAGVGSRVAEIIVTGAVEVGLVAKRVPDPLGFEFCRQLANERGTAADGVIRMGRRLSQVFAGGHHLGLASGRRLS